MQVIYDKTIDSMLSGAHTLIAGTTGSGKTVVLTNIIYHIIQKPPAAAGLILIDPKRVGLSRFKFLPHVRSYSTETVQAVNALKQTINIMEYRYKQIENGVPPGGMLYVVIDELADILILDKKNIMPLLQRLLQLGRESKIKLIVATQAPSRKIIPAELTLNIDTRLALRCISPIESRQIIGIPGAENLPKYGRGILRTWDGVQTITIKPIPPEAINNLIKFWNSTE